MRRLGLRACDQVRHQESGPELPGGFKILHVARVEDVEDPVGEHQGPVDAAPPGEHLRHRDDLGPGAQKPDSTRGRKGM